MIWIYECSLDSAFPFIGESCRGEALLLNRCCGDVGRCVCGGLVPVYTGYALHELCSSSSGNGL